MGSEIALVPQYSSLARHHWVHSTNALEHLSLSTEMPPRGLAVSWSGEFYQPLAQWTVLKKYTTGKIWDTVRAKKKFAVGRPSPPDRSEPLIAACRLHLVTAGSGRLR